MATAYAAFTSLMNLITQLYEHPNPPIRFDEVQVVSLDATISFFQRFLEDHHHTIDRRLEIRLADAAHAAEDLIETRIADGEKEDNLYEPLQRAIETLKLLASEMKQNDHQRGGKQPLPPSSSSSPPSAATHNTVMVGRRGVASQIKDALISPNTTSLHIISIAGMCGVGKTTLAHYIYSDPLITCHFEARAWASVSKDYSRKDIVVDLLHCLLDSEESKERLRQKDEDELGGILYKYFLYQRCLVVLDDLWDVETWNALRCFFPNFAYGSTVVITTRESGVASSNGSRAFGVDLLGEGESWELFCEKVFDDRGDGCCPPELEDVGRSIVDNCRGLPLSIVVIGGHLAKSQKTREYWEYISNNLSSVVNSIDDGRCLKILSTSYVHLPVHLKPCFLYMATLSEDKEIRASRLIRLWAAEGFVKPIDGKSIEEAAEDYLNDLIGRSLVLASELSSRGKVKRCKIHDLLRDFCIKEASKKKFFYVAKKADDLRFVKYERRVVRRHVELEEGHNYSLPYYNVSRSQGLRTLIFDGELSSLKNKKLLRVLAPLDHDGSSSFLLETLDADQLTNIRYFDPSKPFFQDVYRPSPPSMLTFTLLWNLQYLFVNIRIRREAPLEIWKMPQLRDVYVRELTLSYHPNNIDDDIKILKNLQSAQTIFNFSFNEEAAERIPNMKKLKLRYDDDDQLAVVPDEHLKSISRLEKLELLVCSFDLRRVRPSHILRNLAFPNSLRELNFSHLRWEDVTNKIGPLPRLEVLKLCYCEGREWKIDDGGEFFVSLRFLKLSYCASLQRLPSGSCFPRLERLVLEHMDRLDYFTYYGLKSLDVYHCPEKVVFSAEQIASFLSDRTQVQVWLSSESSISKDLRKTNNFHVYYTKR